MVFAIVLGFLVSAWVIAQLLAGKRPAAYHRLADNGKSSTLAGENVPIACLVCPDSCSHAI